MNQHLINHVDAWIDRASNFVCAYMPVDISVDAAYEEMLRCTGVNTEAMIAAFRSAVQYLPQQGHYKRLTFTLPDGRTVSVQARFNPTTKWPTFLTPAHTLAVNPEGKFAALLDTPIRVATEWAHLEYIWQQLRVPMYGLSDEQLVYLLPWLRECLADFEVSRLPFEVKIKERMQIAKELATVMHDVNVLFFPRLSKDLMGVARSGKMLISQFRMIDAAYGQDQLTHSPLTVERDKSLVETWVKEHFTEAMEDWRNDQMRRIATELAARRARDAKKQLKK